MRKIPFKRILGKSQLSHAHPRPTWHSLSREMQLSPHAFPFLHVLQQAKEGLAAKAAEEHGLTAEGPNASDAAAMSIEIFMATLP